MKKKMLLFLGVHYFSRALSSNGEGTGRDSYRTGKY